MQPQAQQLNLPMKDIAGFLFNVGALVALDVSGYHTEPDCPDPHRNQVTLHLIGPIAHVFTGVAADQAYLWYLQLTGQARIAST